MVDQLINFSSLDQFENCERQYWYAHIDGQEKPENETLLVGTIYHAVLAAYFCGPPTGIQRFLDKAIEAELIAHGPELDALKISIPAVRAEMHTTLPALFHEVIAPAGLRALLSPAGAPRVEHKFENPETGFRGTCDLVSATTPVVNARGEVVGAKPEPCIVDWKTKTFTSRSRRTQLDADKSMQLALYSWEEDVFNAAFVEIPRGGSRDASVRVTHYTPGQRAMWVAYLTGQAAALRSRGTTKDAFKRASRKSGLCDPKWCPYYTDCLGTAHLTRPDEPGILPQ